MENKKRFVLIVFGVLLVFNFYSVSAYVGLTPAKIEINFEPSYSFSVDFRILSDHPEQKFETYASGNFEEYVNFSRTNFTGGEGFTVYVDLPEKAKKPGDNYLYIRVGEVVEESSGIGTRLEIGALIIIKVPYPGKYAEIESFSIIEANEGEPVEFNLNVESLGEEDIYVTADIMVYSQGELIDNFALGGKTIKTQTLASFEKIVEEGYQAGIYNSNVIVNYEAGITNSSKQFRIGHLFVEIVNYSSEFVKGKINEFEIDIESKWNDHVQSVYAEVNVTDEGEEVDFFKTPSIELKRWEKKKLKGFFNAEDLDLGDYKAKITLFYGGETTEKEVDIKVVMSDSNKDLYIKIGIGIAVLIAVVVFFLRKKIKFIGKRNG